MTKEKDTMTKHAARNPPRSQLWIGLAALLLAAAPRMLAQPPKAAAPAYAYDVVSIHQNKTESGDTDITLGHNRFSATNVTFKQLLEVAYNIREDMISGISGPVESARFDVEAKVLPPDSDVNPQISDKQLCAMFVPLLVNRFQLKSHIEVKTLPVYELSLLKGPTKFKPSASQDPHDFSINLNGHDNDMALTAKVVSMPGLADALADRVHRIVLDKTGLAGQYDVDLKWSPDDVVDADPTKAISIFTALQEQLGLKLQSTHGPVNTLVIDHVEMPSAN
jgi:uncharacterized protein (TIGR03435 family)